MTPEETTRWGDTGLREAVAHLQDDRITGDLRRKTPWYQQGSWAVGRGRQRRGVYRGNIRVRMDPRKGEKTGADRDACGVEGHKRWDKRTGVEATETGWR